MADSDRTLQRLETDSLVFLETAGTEGPYAVIDVRSKRPDESVGAIRWFGAKHQYAYFPVNGSVYIGRQMCDIYDVLGRMMNARRRSAVPR